MRRWHPPTHRSTAILVPSTMAGALYMLLAGLFTTLDTNDPKVFDPQVAVAVIPIAVAATFFGFFLALLPMLLGVMAMYWLGSWNLGLRHPAAWGLAGAGITSAFVWGINGWEATYAQGLAAGFVATGALCAMLARRYVRWPDQEEWQ